MAVKKRSGGRLSRAASLANEINSTLKLERPILLGNDPYFEIVRIPTGSLVMDRVTGGGFALGRQYEIFGDESAGKSYIVYRTMALSQQRGNTCALIDPEHSFDGDRFEFLGGKPDELMLLHPENAEEAVAVMMMLAKHAEAGDIEVVGVDSVASLVPEEDMAKDPRDAERIGGQARMMSRALRKINTVNTKTLFLWINQTRVNVGVKFGNPETTSGGRALRFYATGRIEMKRGTAVRDKRKKASGAKLVEKEMTVGRWTQVRVVKDKSTIPMREGAFVFNYDMKMVDPSSEIITLGLEDGLISRNGNFLLYYDLEDKEWKGTEKKFGKYLRDNDELREEIESVIRDNTTQLGMSATDEELDEDEGEDADG